jgi:flagellar operon protein (TIGR03826 family)
MAELANCTRCGNVFAKSIRAICNTCYREEEKAFDTVYRFLRRKENREATIPEIVAATDVDEALIIKFMKGNRLRASQFPKLAYPCETCGISIVSGRVCDSCSKEILEGFKQDKTGGKQSKVHEPDTVYYAIHKHKEELH